MKKSNGNKPAMPLTMAENGDEILDISDYDKSGDGNGLTKREMIAMHAMQGLLSSDNASVCFYKSDSDARHIAESSVAYADALLEELEK